MAAATAPRSELERLFARREIAILRMLELARRHEHEPVLVGMLDAEPGVPESELPDGVDGVGGRGLLGQMVEQAREVLVAQGLYEVVLVFEMVVDGGGGVFDRVRDAPHGDAVVALTREQVARGVEDLPPDLFSLALASFDHAHSVPPMVNNVNYRTDVPIKSIGNNGRPDMVQESATYVRPNPWIVLHLRSLVVEGTFP